MGQRGHRPANPHFVALFAAALLTCIHGCEQRAATTTTHTRPTVASLSPAGTDILVAIGAQDHLVAVSHYDTGKPAVSKLPGVGDYLTVDW
jgi:ABC-type hemin transport system substrate-binding protein